MAALAPVPGGALEHAGEGGAAHCATAAVVQSVHTEHVAVALDHHLATPVTAGAAAVEVADVARVRVVHAVAHRDTDEPE